MRVPLHISAVPKVKYDIYTAMVQLFALVARRVCIQVKGQKKRKRKSFADISICARSENARFFAVLEMWRADAT